MAPNKDFDLEDLVWAKMKGFPFWPGKIVNPPTHAKSTSKKRQHYVLFFGSENYAWIPDENIVHHSEEMLQSTSTKKKSNLLRTAIEKITEEASQKDESLVKEKESPEASTSGTKRKNTKNQRIETESLKVEKIAVKRQVLDESPNASSPSKRRHISEAFSELIKKSFPHIDSNHVAFVKPSEHAFHSCPETTERYYYTLKPDPAFNVDEPHEFVKSKKVVPTKKKIGFIGLGMMGQRLVRNLLTTKHEVTVWNRTTDKCEEFAKFGASVAQTPGDVVAKCDITLCCVSGPEASKSVIFGNCGILSALEKFPPGSKSYVEMTTLDPDTSVKMGEYITEKGGRYLETPIIGSRTMAEEGSLIILAAGDREVFLACETIFYALGVHAFYLDSEVGVASKHYLIHNMLMGISQAALGQAMALVKRSNLPTDNFRDILLRVPLNSPLITEKARYMEEYNFSSNTPLKYQQRDLNLAISLSNMCKQRVLVATATNEVYKRAKYLRYSDHDASAVMMGVRY